MADFEYYNANPKGLRTGDCVIRAFSFFFGTTWRSAFDDLLSWCADRGLVNFNYRSSYNKYLSEKGYERHRTPKKGLTVCGFCNHFAESGKTYIVSMKGHLTIVQDGKIIDTWDCSDKVIDGYWER